LRFTVITNKKREGINTFVCAVSLYVAETPACRASIKDQDPALPIVPFGIVSCGFVGPLSKQLYTDKLTLTFLMGYFLIAV